MKAAAFLDAVEPEQAPSRIDSPLRESDMRRVAAFTPAEAEANRAYETSDAVRAELEAAIAAEKNPTARAALQQAYEADFGGSVQQPRSRGKASDFLDGPATAKRSRGKASDFLRGNDRGGAPIDTSRPIINNPDGSFSTERTITIEVDGRHIVLPTIIDGKQVAEEQAIQAWRQGRNRAVGEFDTAREAEAYARQRSAEIGRARGADRAVIDRPARMTMTRGGQPVLENPVAELRTEPPGPTIHMPGSIFHGEPVLTPGSPRIEDIGGPASDAFVVETRRALEAMTPEEREQVAARKDMRGSVARKILEGWARQDEAGARVPAVLAITGRVEDRAQRLARGGYDPALAGARAIAEAKLGIPDQTDGAVRKSLLDFDAERSIPRRAWNDFSSGVVGSTGAALAYAGRKSSIDAVENLGDAMTNWSEAKLPARPTEADQLVSAVGSMASFFVPGLGVMKGANALAVLSPALAKWAGTGVMSALEAAAEADQVYRDTIRQGVPADQATAKAEGTFWANMALLGVTNKLGLFNDVKRLGKRIAAGAITEGPLQEGPQQVIQNYFTGRPLDEGVAQATAIGAIVGGGAAGVHGALSPRTRDAAQTGGAGAARPLQEAAQAASVAPATAVPPSEPTASAPATPTALDEQEDRGGDDNPLARVAQLDARIAALDESRQAGGWVDSAEFDSMVAERDNLRASLPRIVPGAPTTITAGNGVPEGGEYGLIELDDLRAPMDEFLRPTERFPDALKVKDRTRADTSERVRSIVERFDPARLGASYTAEEGAPVIGRDGAVEAGVNRALALKQIYQANGAKAASYRQHLDAAAPSLGLDVERLRTMRKPVLVRVRRSSTGRAEFASRATRGDGSVRNPIIVTRSDDIATAASISDDPSGERKGYFRFAPDAPLGGLGTIALEVDKGSARVAKDGSWSVPDMPAHYGHLGNARGADGDNLRDPVAYGEAANAAPHFQRIWTGEVEGTPVIQHAVRDPRSNRVLGSVTVHEREDRPVVLFHIEAATRESGESERILAAVLERAKGEEVYLAHIEPQAKDWWRRMGAKFLDAAGSIDATISLEGHQAAVGKGGQVAAGGVEQAGAGAHSDRDRKNREEAAATAQAHREEDARAQVRSADGTPRHQVERSPLALPRAIDGVALTPIAESASRDTAQVVELHPAKQDNGAPIQALVRPGTPADGGGNVFLVEQVDPRTGSYARTLPMLGYQDHGEALASFLNHAGDGRAFGAMVRIQPDAFRSMLERPAELTRPAIYQRPKGVSKGDARHQAQARTRATGALHVDLPHPWERDRFIVLQASSPQAVAWGRAYQAPAAAEATGDPRRGRPDVIRDTVRRLLNVPINEKHLMNPRALGIYKVFPRTIRLRNQNDVDVLMHEVGHHFSESEKAVREHMQAHEAELLKLTPAAYAKESKALRREEGFAEFVRLYLTQREVAERSAPKFFEAFERFVQEAGYAPILSEVADLVNQWHALSPAERIFAKVGRGKPPFLQRVRDALDLNRFIFEVLDNWQPFKLMVKDLAPGGVAPSKDPFKASHLLAGDGAVIEDWIVHGTVPFDLARRADPRNYGKPLKEILKPVAKDLREFSAYLIARRAAELSRVDKEHLFSIDEIRAGLQLETPAFRKAAGEVYRYNDQLIDYAVEGGLLSPAVAQKMRSYTAYIPFFRESEAGPRSSKKEPFHKLQGGTENLHDPIANIVQNTANIVYATNRNAVLRKAFALARSTPGGGRWIEEIPLPRREVKVPTEQIIKALGEQGVQIDQDVADGLAAVQSFFQSVPADDMRAHTVIVRVDGEPRALQINSPMLWKALQAFEPVDLGIIGTMLAMPSDLLRAGVTLSPEFMARNFMRDTISGYMQSKPGLVPILHTVGGFKEVATRSDAAKLFRAYGGAFADLWQGESDQVRAQLERMATRGNFDPRTILTPSGIIRLLSRIGSISEAGTRVAEFKRTAKAGDIDSLIDAAYNSREVSVDFGMHGHSRAIRVLTRITPFLNPAMQGFYKLARTGRERMLVTAMRGSILTLASVALYLLNRGEDWYDELEAWERNVYWHFDLGLRDPDNKVIPVRVPKPFEWGAVFGSVPEAMTQVAIDRNGAEFAKRLKSVVVDVFALRAVPTAVLVPMELWANQNTFTGRPIVGQSKERLEPEFQAGPQASLSARNAGELLGVSPAKIDHAIRGYFGTMGTYSVMLADQIIRAAGDFPQPVEKTWQQYPVVRAFVHDPNNPNSRYVTDFYKVLDRARRAGASQRQIDTDALEAYQARRAKELDALQGANATARRINALRRMNEEIVKSREYSSDEKLRMVNENNAEIRALAKEFMKEQEQ